MKTRFSERTRTGGRRAIERLFMGAVLSGAVCVSSAFAAPTIAFTEAFADGSSGWNKTGSVQFVEGEVQVKFLQQGGPGGPESAAILCSGGSGGVFQGDYLGRGADVLGFDFKSDNIPPSALNLFIAGAGRTYQRALRPLVGTVGGWVTLSLRVDGKASGEWVGPGDEADFAQTLASVESISIRAERASSAAATYRIDNVYLYSAPSAAVRLGGGAEEAVPQVEWNPLRSNRLYAVMVSTDLVSGVWEVDHTFRAGEQTAVFELPDAPAAFMFIKDQNE